MPPSRRRPVPAREMAGTPRPPKGPHRNHVLEPGRRAVRQVTPPTCACGVQARHLDARHGPVRPSRYGRTTPPTCSPRTTAFAVKEPGLPRAMTASTCSGTRAIRAALPRRSATQGDYSEPVFPLEDDVQTGANNRHQQDRERIPEHPVQLRHPIEVHPVDRADQRRREQNGRPRRDLFEVVYLVALTCGDGA